MSHTCRTSAPKTCRGQSGLPQQGASPKTPFRGLSHISHGKWKFGHRLEGCDGGVKVGCRHLAGLRCHLAKTRYLGGFRWPICHVVSAPSRSQGASLRPGKPLGPWGLGEVGVAMGARVELGLVLSGRGEKAAETETAPLPTVQTVSHCVHPSPSSHPSYSHSECLGGPSPL